MTRRYISNSLLMTVSRVNCKNAIEEIDKRIHL